MRDGSDLKHYVGPLQAVAIGERNGRLSQDFARYELGIWFVKRALLPGPNRQ